MSTTEQKIDQLFSKLEPTIQKMTNEQKAYIFIQLAQTEATYAIAEILQNIYNQLSEGLGIWNLR